MDEAFRVDIQAALGQAAVDLDKEVCKQHIFNDTDFNCLFT